MPKLVQIRPQGASQQAHENKIFYLYILFLEIHARCLKGRGLTVGCAYKYGSGIPKIGYYYPLTNTSRDIAHAEWPV